MRSRSWGSFQDKRDECSPYLNRQRSKGDGGFSSQNFNWAHMEGYEQIAGVSVHRLKAVQENFLSWDRSLSLDDFSKEWEINGSLYISHRVPITIGGVEG